MEEYGPPWGFLKKWEDERKAQAKQLKQSWADAAKKAWMTDWQDRIEKTVAAEVAFTANVQPILM